MGEERARPLDMGVPFPASVDLVRTCRFAGRFRSSPFVFSRRGFHLSVSLDGLCEPGMISGDMDKFNRRGIRWNLHWLALVPSSRGLLDPVANMDRVNYSREGYVPSLRSWRCGVERHL